MKKAVITLIILGIISLGACGFSPETKAGEDEAPNSYLENVEKYNTFNAIEWVHEPTGCHYLIVNTPDGNSNRPTVIQMRDADDKPYCKK